MRVGIFLFALLSVAVWSAGANPRVTLQISGAVTGTIVLELFPEQAPVTVANFVNYVQSGFYNGLIFHRVIPGFMIQGGGFDTSLVQKPAGPMILNESSNRLSNLLGTLAMARTSVADSATSQFYINLEDNPFLDYGAQVYDYYYDTYFTQVGYCVFGRVVSGMNVVSLIAAVSTGSENGMPNVPKQDVIIQSATVTLAAPVCASYSPGDVNKDCRVDLGDLLTVAQHWLECDSVTPVCN